MSSPSEIIDIVEKVFSISLAAYAAVRVTFQRNSDKLTKQLEKMDEKTDELSKDLRNHVLDDTKIQATLVEKVDNIEHNIGSKLDVILDKIND